MSKKQNSKNDTMIDLKEGSTNNETRRHIANVSAVIHAVVCDLLARADAHDRSKLYDPELAFFTKLTEKLAGCTFGSKEHKRNMASLKPALDHHYAVNRHHPEHHSGGINDMTLIDLVEMFCDWKASSKRHNDGNLLKSLDLCSKRFKMSPQMERIFRNTAKAMDR